MIVNKERSRVTTPTGSSACGVQSRVDSHLAMGDRCCLVLVVVEEGVFGAAKLLR